MPDVTGISVNSILGSVLIALVIGTFLITLVSGIINIIAFSKKNKQIEKQDNNMCQRHEDSIEQIQTGFAEIKTDIGKVHGRIDRIFELISTNGNSKKQIYK